MKRAVACLVVLGALSIAKRADADPPRVVPGAFAADRFAPAPPGDHFLAVQGAGTDGEQLFRAALTLEDAAAPLVARHASAAVISDELVFHASFSAAIWNRFLLSTSVPFILVAAGNTATPANDASVRLRPPERPDVGDVVAGLRLRAYSTSNRALETAVGVTLWAATGRVATYSGDGSPRFFPYLAASGEAQRFVYAVRIGPIFQSSIDFVDLHLGKELRGEAAAAWSSSRGVFEIGPEVLLDVPLGGGDPGHPTSVSLETLASARYRLGPMVFGALAGPGVLRGPGTPVFRGLFSVAYVPRGDVDTDRDGVPDRSDACPRLPGVSSEDRDVDGCPSDRDGDGIVDGEDACPDDPGVASPDPKKNGCPKVIDRDGDGIADTEDACPDKRGPRNADPRRNGCPADRDGDGIADVDDACPDVAGVDDPDPKKRGCPVDTDGDGIPDAEDACPAVKGVKSADPKQNGCPEAKPSPKR